MSAREASIARHANDSPPIPLDDAANAAAEDVGSPQHRDQGLFPLRGERLPLLDVVEDGHADDTLPVNS